MIRSPRLPRPGSLSWGASAIATLALIVPVAVLLATGLPGAEPLPLPGQASTEVHFPAPVRYAIIIQKATKVRTLYARANVIFDPQTPTRSWTVDRIEPAALTLREGPRGRVQTLQLGAPLPGFPGLTFAGTVMLDQLRYQYKAVDRLAHPEPILLTLEGSRAVLEVEVLRSRATLDGELLRGIRVRELGPNLYEVNTADVQAVLENSGRVLADLAPAVLPSLSLQTGLEYRISSAASDGVLSGQGFTVTAPKLAEQVGLQTGDTILSVNGQPVDGFASLYRIYREVSTNPALNTIQIELDRKGSRLTKTYRIR